MEQPGGMSGIQTHNLRIAGVKIVDNIQHLSQLLHRRHDDQEIAIQIKEIYRHLRYAK